MLELQVKDELLFNELIPYADYYSERTRVVSIPESKRNLIPKNYPVNVVNKKPELYYNKRKFYISGVDEVVKLFLGFYNLAGTSFSFKSLDRLNDLLASGVVTPSKEFLSIFPPLKENAQFKDLVCSDCGFKVGNKIRRYKDVMDVYLKDVYLNPDVNVKRYNTYPFKPYDVYTENDKKGRTRMVIAGTYKDGKDEYDLSVYLYGAVSNFEKVFSKETSMNVVLDENKKYVTFAPLEVNKTEDVIISPNSAVKKTLNKLPVLLYRIANEEIKLREIINRKDN